MTRMMEGKKAVEWYTMLWANVKGPKILEVGVGTGRSFTYYPPDVNVTAIDISERMLARAKQKAGALAIPVTLKEMDIQKLEFPDNSFDNIVASCTFCSVPDPVMGLQEIDRVVKPGGKVYFLEHMRHGNRFWGGLMDLFNPLSMWLIGPAINRRTLDNIRKAGLEIVKVENLALGGILKLIVARSNKVD